MRKLALILLLWALPAVALAIPVCDNLLPANCIKPNADGTLNDAVTNAGTFPTQDNGTNSASIASNTSTTSTNLGAPGVTACATDNGSCSLNALIERNNQRLTTLITALNSPFQAGGSIGNTAFGINQTTDGTTNAVAIHGSASSDGSGTQTTGGTAQALFSSATPAHGWKVENLGASNCYVSDTTATPSATTAGSYIVFANGGQYATEPGELPAGAVYLNCPTTGQVFSAKKW